MYMGIEKPKFGLCILIDPTVHKRRKKMQCNAIIQNSGLKLKHVPYYSILKCCTIDLAIFVKQQEQCIVL